MISEVDLRDWCESQAHGADPLGLETAAAGQAGERGTAPVRGFPGNVLAPWRSAGGAFCFLYLPLFTRSGR